MYISDSQYKELEQSVNELIQKMDQLKVKYEMLEKENVYLRGLVDKLTEPVVNNPNTFRVAPNEWPAPQPPYKFDNIKAYTGCTTCGITGANGYVCPRTDCPTRISCQTK